MAISFNAVMSFARSNGGAFGDARFGVKRGKTATADGSTVDIRLRKSPASLDTTDMESAAMGGIDIGGTLGASYARSIGLTGAAAKSVIRSAIANDADIAPVVPAVDADPAPSIETPAPVVPAVDADPAPSIETPAPVNRNGERAAQPA